MEAGLLALAGSGPGVAGRRSLDDYADQVYVVAEHVGVSLRLVGFSWGGATALRVAAAAPELVDSLAVIEPEAYAARRFSLSSRAAETYGTAHPPQAAHPRPPYRD